MTHVSSSSYELGPWLRPNFAHLSCTCHARWQTRCGQSWGGLVVGGGRGERVKTLSLQQPGSGQIQCTSWRNFAPFSSSIINDIHASAQA
jgi:hypothetical protein